MCDDCNTLYELAATLSSFVSCVVLIADAILHVPDIRCCIHSSRGHKSTIRAVLSYQLCLCVLNKIVSTSVLHTVSCDNTRAGKGTIYRTVHQTVFRGTIHSVTVLHTIHVQVSIVDIHSGEAVTPAQGTL
ncbi:hypothetical protein ABBQ32_002696 [Trebouxia sp. C0010 RCD-2024]